MITDKKILLVSFSNISDHQDKVVVMYEEMKRQGFNVYLMLPKEADVECEHSPTTWFVDCPNRPGISKGTFNILNLFHVVKRVRKARIDYVFFESLHVWNLPLMSLSGRSTKVFQMIHDVIPHGGDRGAKQVELMNKMVCRWADRVIICNHKYKDYLCSHYNVYSEKVSCIELWERFPAFQESDKNGHMLFFGRLNPYKGANNLLEIVSLCPDIQFDVVGRPDQQVACVIEKLKSYPNVTVDDRYISDNEIATVFRNSEWVILPYNSATQSGVVVEAYKNSKPVISFDVGALSEQIEEGKTGYLVKEGDIAAFVQTIQKANQLSNEAYKKLCRDAYDYGYKKFSPINAARAIAQLFA